MDFKLNQEIRERVFQALEYSVRNHPDSELKYVDLCKVVEQLLDETFYELKRIQEQ